MPFTRLGVKRSILVNYDEAQGFTCLIVILDRFRNKNAMAVTQCTHIRKRAWPMAEQKKSRSVHSARFALSFAVFFRF